MDDTDHRGGQFSVRHVSSDRRKAAQKGAELPPIPADRGAVPPALRQDHGSGAAGGVRHFRGALVLVLLPANASSSPAPDPVGAAAGAGRYVKSGRNGVKKEIKATRRWERISAPTFLFVMGRLLLDRERRNTGGPRRCTGPSRCGRPCTWWPLRCPPLRPPPGRSGCPPRRGSG